VHVLDAAGEPRPVPIRIGIGDGTVTEVIAGELKEGDRVVTGTARGPAPARPASGGLLPRFGF
jgi:HlyD family secretion protein